MGNKEGKENIRRQLVAIKEVVDQHQGMPFTIREIYGMARVPSTLRTICQKIGLLAILGKEGKKFKYAWGTHIIDDSLVNFIYNEYRHRCDSFAEVCEKTRKREQEEKQKESESNIYADQDVKALADIVGTLINQVNSLGHVITALTEEIRTLTLDINELKGMWK